MINCKKKKKIGKVQEIFGHVMNFETAVAEYSKKKEVMKLAEAEYAKAKKCIYLGVEVEDSIKDGAGEAGKQLLKELKAFDGVVLGCLADNKRPFEGKLESGVYRERVHRVQMAATKLIFAKREIGTHIDKLKTARNKISKVVELATLDGELTEGEANKLYRRINAKNSNSSNNSRSQNNNRIDRRRNAGNIGGNGGGGRRGRKGGGRGGGHGGGRDDGRRSGGDDGRRGRQRR